MPNPIKAETVYPVPFKFVEWMITDSCNYDCSFCGEENKAGRRGRLDLETNKKIVDAIAEECAGYPYWITVTGGEPTLYPKLLELLTYMKEKGAMIKLISNGSRTLRWWTELRNAALIDMLYITYHSGQTNNYQHLADVLNLFHDEKTVTISLATYTRDTVDQVLLGSDYLRDHTGALIYINAMDFGSEEYMYETVDQEKFEKIKEYTWFPGKLAATKKPHILPVEYFVHPDVRITYDDGTFEEGDDSFLMKVGKNRFLGWSCEIGMNTMKIEVDTIYRGGCRVGSKPFTIDNIKFWKEPVICTKSDCCCSTDMLTTKVKNLE